MNRARRSVRNRPPASVGNRGGVNGRGGTTPRARGGPAGRITSRGQRGTPGLRPGTGRGSPSVRGSLPRGQPRGRGQASEIEIKKEVDNEIPKMTETAPHGTTFESRNILDDLSTQKISLETVKKEPPPLATVPTKSILKKETHSQDYTEIAHITPLQSVDASPKTLSMPIYQAISPVNSPGTDMMMKEMDVDNPRNSLEPLNQRNGNDDNRETSKGDEEQDDIADSADVENKPVKRKREGDDKFPKKRRKSDHGMIPKNPLMKLNELRPGLTYVIEKQEGPSHNPTFWVSVTVDGEKHMGKGRSKQDAKHSAALAALSSFVQFPDQSEVSQMMPQIFTGKTDFTSDSVEEETFFNVSAMKQKMKYEFNQIFMPKKSRIQKALAGFETKSPVMLLNELHPGSEYTLVEEVAGIPTHRFTISVSVNNVPYEGSGQSKKQAKAAAARAALVSIYHIPLTGGFAGIHSGDATAPPMSGLKQSVADKIATTVYETFSQIIVGFDDNKKWKVLSGIVMTTDEDMEKMTVVGVSTGTKCISGEHISMNGAALNDCHAEIISRRCFKDFMYSQLERFCQGNVYEDCILVQKETGGFLLKPHVKFHLFISTAPCGDARIFSPHELEFGDKVDKHPNRKGRGLLRTKIEAGEGTIPVKSGESIQTWDGIQGGQRLLTMSCSDKIARWNVLGLQGTLLSLFLEPIYLESIILGSMYHEDHMYRAIGKRIEGTMGKLPIPYRLVIPKLNIVTSTETRQASKSPTYSVNWSLGLSKPEIVNGTTGKLHNGQLSRLAKRSFYSRFQKIRLKVPFLNGKELEHSEIYAEEKFIVEDYQNAKEIVCKSFQEAGLGTWVKKPPEQDEFEVNFF